MHKVQIGSTAHAEQVRRRLEFEATFMRDQGFAVEIARSAHGPLTLYTVSCSPPGACESEGTTAIDTVRHHLANAVSDLVVNLWERRLLHKLASSDAGALDPGERRAIVRQAEIVLDGQPWRPQARLTRKVARKGHVLHEVDRYLQSHELLVIDGFIRFRLRSYLEMLTDAVDQAMDEFLIEKEYREFILLLKHFLAAQEPRLDRVHVLLASDGSFKLVDDSGSSVSEQFLTECLEESGTDEVNRNDLLISALITVAPRKVRLHTAAGVDSEALRTLTAVFGERLTTCHGCQLCNVRVLRWEEGDRYC